MTSKSSPLRRELVESLYLQDVRYLHLLISQNRDYFTLILEFHNVHDQRTSAPLDGIVLNNWEISEESPKPLLDAIQFFLKTLLAKNLCKPLFHMTDDEYMNLKKYGFRAEHDLE